MLKTLSAYIGEYKKDVILTPICMVLEVILETFIPYVMAFIIDVGIANEDLGYIFKMSGLLLVLAALGLLTGLGGAKYGSRASAGFAKNLRYGMFSNIEKYSFANIDKFSTAGLITRLTTDVTNIQNAFMMLLRMAFRAPVSIVFALVLAFTINPRLASIYLVAVFFLACVVAFIMLSTHKYFRQLFDKYDEMNASTQENIAGMRVVKAYVREDYEIKRFKKASKLIYDLSLKAEKRITYMSPVMMTTVYCCIMLTSWIGAKMIVGGSLQTGELMSLLTYCMNILMNLMMLSMIFMMVIMSSASANRVAEVLNEIPTLANPEEPVFEVADGSIEFDHVNFKYNTEGTGDNILSDINLKIKPGEFIGIIGGTGSAKSTLVSLISRLYDATEGSVSVGGRNVKDYDMSALRDQVSVVLQKNVLFSGTILDNLRWGKEDATEAECVRACKLACADDFITSFPDGYNTYIEQGGSNVSGGQKQRLCIARALLKNPKILILDDSTSAVDTATDAKIRKAFADEIPGVTKIIIAQRISSVSGCDRVIVMDKGRIDAFDTPDNLLSGNEIYRDVYESQTGGNGDFDGTAADL